MREKMEQGVLRVVGRFITTPPAPHTLRLHQLSALMLLSRIRKTDQTKPEHRSEEFGFVLLYQESKHRQ